MRLGRVASVASPRLARTVVRRPPRSRGRRCRNQSRRRGRGRPRRIPKVCTIYKIRNNHVYIRSKTLMYLYYIALARPSRARSRGAGRATGVAHLYIKHESITYTLPPKTPIYIAITHQTPAISVCYDRDRAAEARRRRFPRRRRFLHAARRAHGARSRRGNRRASFERTRSRARTARARRRAFRAPQNAARAHRVTVDAKKRRRFVG